MCKQTNIQRIFKDTTNKVFTEFQFLFQVSKQCQRISAFFKQSCLIDDPRYSQWLRKKTDGTGIMQLLQKLLCF